MCLWLPDMIWLGVSRTLNTRKRVKKTLKGGPSFSSQLPQMKKKALSIWQAVRKKLLKTASRSRSGVEMDVYELSETQSAKGKKIKKKRISVNDRH